MSVNLVASVIVYNERHRYLQQSLASLLEFCDEVRVYDDGSTDDWISMLEPWFGVDAERVMVGRAPSSTFFTHEGRTRQALLDWTMEAKPTHVLAIDADEFVGDGAAVRRACVENDHRAWGLCMQEVWKADENGLYLRQDGGWVEHDVTMLWSVKGVPATPKMMDRALACGRVPLGVGSVSAGHTGTACLHFGWTNVPERQARYERYAVNDGGKFHANTHLESIMLPDEEIEMNETPWPAAFTNARIEGILTHAGVKS